jgi:hypothetical protein
MSDTHVTHAIGDETTPMTCSCPGIGIIYVFFGTDTIPPCIAASVSFWRQNNKKIAVRILNYFKMPTQSTHRDTSC